MSTEGPRTVLAVDGNSLLHRAFHASARTGFRLEGQPAWAVRGLLSQLTAAVDRASADAIVVGFDDRGNSVRKQRWPIYKAQRTPKPDTLEQQIDLAVQTLRALGIAVVVPSGLEADDVLASVAAQAPTYGARTVVVTSDRDSFSLIGEHTRMLRILNGGVDASPMLDPARLALVTGVRPDQYPDLAALRGDASDNLPGVRGFGAKTAVALLTALDSAESAFADARGDGERCRAAVGAARTKTLAGDEAREQFDLNRAVMAQVIDVEVGDLATVGSVPLDEEVVRDVYGRFDLHVVAAIRSLTLREPTRAVEPTYVEPHWRAPSAPALPPLPKPDPEPQLTLF